MANETQNNGYYTRDSFDRFGDDLCEAILAFLPTIAYRVRFETVSRQWRRLVYSPVREFVYHLFDPIPDDYWYWNLPELVKYRISGNILKKCHNIQRLTVRPVCDSELLALISDNCPALQELSVRFEARGRPIEPKVCESFARNCGQTLCALTDRTDHLSPPDNIAIKLLNQYSDCFPMLRYISLTIDDSVTGFDSFLEFTGKFRNRIRRMNLRLVLNKSVSVKKISEQLSEYKSLNSLSLIIGSAGQLELEFTESLNKLSQNCKNLCEFSVEIREGLRSSEKLLNSLESFTTLAKLTVRIRSNGLELGSLSALRALTRLRSLDILYKNFSDDDVKDIHKYCPQLSSFRVQTQQTFSDKALHSLANVRSLRALSIHCRPFEETGITDPGVGLLLDGCPDLTDINFKCNIQFGDQTLDRLIGLARSSPKRRLRFLFCWRRTGAQNESLDSDSQRNVASAAWFWPVLNGLPPYLIVYSREYFDGGSFGTDHIWEIHKYEREFTHKSGQNEDDIEDEWRKRYTDPKYDTYRH